MRPVLPALAASALLLAALTACTGDGGTDSAGGGGEDCTPLASGSVSDAITVTDVEGGEPTVDFSAPLEVETSERTVTTEGDGAVLADGDTFSLEFAVYDGTTAEKLGSTGFTGEAAVEPELDDEQLPPVLYDVLKCSTIGDTLVAAISADDASVLGFTEDGADPTPLVFLAEIGEKKAAVEPKKWTENVPEVDLSTDVPTVTLPDTPASTELELAVLTAGDGDTVEDGDTVTLDYQGISWDTKEIFDQSFGKDSPLTTPTGGVIEGFGAALVGQKVGSTVIVTIPPALAYGTDPEAHQLGGQTLVFLIEIQKTESGS